MVAWSDFLAASPATETWHFLLGLAIVLLAAVLLRFNPLLGGVVLGAFIAAVAIKEFWLDIILEGATVNGGAVDASFFYLGGAFGGLVGFVRGLHTVIVVTVGTVLVVVLLFAGVI